MEELQQAGWYEDPRGSGGLRFYDGEKWTDIVDNREPKSGSRARAEASIADDCQESEIPQKAGAYLSFSSLIGRVSRLSAILFLVGIVLSYLLSMGAYRLSGVTLANITNWLGGASVVLFVADSVVGVPLRAWGQLIKAKYAAAALRFCEEELLAMGMAAGEVGRCMIEIQKRTASVVCAVFAAAAFIACLIYGALLESLGAPWTEAIIVFLLPVVCHAAGIAILSRLDFAAKKKQGAVYAEANKLLNAIGC